MPPRKNKERGKAQATSGKDTAKQLSKQPQSSHSGSNASFTGRGNQSKHLSKGEPNDDDSDDDHNHPGEDEYDEDGLGHAHGAPTKIPFYVVWTLVLATIIGFFFIHILEDRPFLVSQGVVKPYWVPDWLSQDTLGPLSSVARMLFYFTPFSTHPFSLITFAYLSLALIISFVQVNKTEPGFVSPNSIWSLTTQAQKDHNTPPVPSTVERKHDGTIRFCRKSQCFKPDRSHYCHAKQQLVDRFDHYCIFVDSTIGFNNHKFFILFLLYIALLGFFMAIQITIPMQLFYLLDGPHLILVVGVFAMAAACSFALALFLVFHLYLIAISATTLEQGAKFGSVRLYDGNITSSSQFNIDLYYNFTQIFGHDILTWALPFVHPTRLPCEDGTFWLTNSSLPSVSLPTYHG